MRYTSIDEICKATELTKGAFFHYFKSKEELGKEVLEHYSHSLQRKMAGASFRREHDALKRVYAYIDFNIKMTQEPVFRHGCLF